MQKLFGQFSLMMLFSRVNETIISLAMMQVSNAADIRLSPLCAESHKGLPPAFIQVGGRDLLRDEAIVYGEVLAKNGVPVKTKV